VADNQHLSHSAQERLCLSCGLCCNGDIHNWTHLRFQEIAHLRALGIEVIMLPEGGPAFYQPCALLDDQACTIYAQRPHACRDYECKLYRSLNSGEIDLEDAFQHTRRLRHLITGLRSHMLEVDDGLPLERQARYQWSRLDPPPEAASVLNELVELLRTHFGVLWTLPARAKKTG
jgi:uncharacterized protein